jgi:hypothetical protein
VSNALISAALAGGLAFCLFGFVLFVCDVRRPKVASAILGSGLFLWAAGLYCAAPLVRIIAFSLFAMFTVVAVPLALAVASKSQQRRVGSAYLPLVILPVAAALLSVVGSNFNRLLAAQKSLALTLTSEWLAAASVFVIAIALAIALAFPRGRTQRATG